MGSSVRILVILNESMEITMEGQSALDLLIESSHTRFYPQYAKLLDEEEGTQRYIIYISPMQVYPIRWEKQYVVVGMPRSDVSYEYALLI